MKEVVCCVLCVVLTDDQAKEEKWRILWLLLGIIPHDRHAGSIYSSLTVDNIQQRGKEVGRGERWGSTYNSGFRFIFSHNSRLYLICFNGTKVNIMMHHQHSSSSSSNNNKTTRKYNIAVRVFQ